MLSNYTSSRCDGHCDCKVKTTIGLSLLTHIWFVRAVMFYLCSLYLFKNTGLPHYFRWYSCQLTITWQVSLVMWELLIPWSTLVSPGISRVHVTGSYVFCVVFCRSLFVLLSFFLCWSLYTLSVHLRLLITRLVYSNAFFSMMCCTYLSYYRFWTCGISVAFLGFFLSYF